MIFLTKTCWDTLLKACNIRDWKSYAVREPNIAKQLEKCIALLYYYFSYTKSVAQSWMDNATLLLLYPKFCMHLYLRFSTTFVLVLRAQNFSCPGIEGMFFIFVIQVLYKSIQPFVFVCIFRRPRGGSGGWMTWQLESRVDAKFGSLLVLVSLVPFSNPCLACEAHTKKENSNFQRKFISM